LPVGRIDAGNGLAQFGDGGAGMAAKRLALRRQPYAGPAALEQRHADRRFEFADRLGDGGLGDPQRPRRTDEAAAAGDLEKAVQMPEPDPAAQGRGRLQRHIRLVMETCHNFIFHSKMEYLFWNTKRGQLEFARVNAITLCHSVVRAGEDRGWLVFVNSLGTDHRIWAPVAAALAPSWNILTYDKRGHGLSDTGSTPYAMEDHVDDLAGLLAHLGISRAAVCGLSVGGMVALGLAAQHPERVSALILCDTGARIGDVELWNARIEAIRTRGMAAVADGVLERWFTEPFRASDNPVFAGYRNMLLRTDPEGYAGTIAAIRDTDYTELARTLTVPTLCVVGEHDLVTPPADMGGLAELIEGARLERIANAAHQPQIEQPQALSRLISGFLEETAP
jgi:3-oxoadipate enol-lactonase